MDAAADAAADDPVGEADAPVCIASIAPDKLDAESDIDVDAEVPAAPGAVVAVCAITGPASAIGNVLLLP